MGCEGEIKGRMQFPVFEVGHGLLHGLNRFRQKQDVATRMVRAERVDPLPQGFQEGMGFRETFTAGALPFEQKRNRIKPEAVDSSG